MTDLALEKILAAVSNLTPAQKLLVCDALTSSAVKTTPLDDDISASAAINPAYLARIQAGVGEAKRLNVKIREGHGGKLVVDVNELNTALQASGKDPQARMAIKKTLHLAGMID